MLLLVVALVAAPFARPPADGARASRARKLVWVAGAVLGLLLWHVAGEIGGDGLFHLARARKLVELGDLHLSSVNEFADGGLHPGYAFPLWQAFLALIAKVAFVDPSKVVLHEATVLAPLAVLVAYEAGYAALPAGRARRRVGRRRGRRSRRWRPGTAARSPRSRCPRRRRGSSSSRPRSRSRSRRCATPTKALLASVGVASLVLAVVHPTYAIFLWIPFARLPRRALGVAVREVRQRLAHPRRARRPGRALPRLAPARRAQARPR